MTNDTSWLDFLRAQGAHVSADGDIERFGAGQALPAPSPAALVALTQLSLIRVSGRDALAFLQAQLTSDVRDITGEKAGFSGYCTPKGRLLATMLLLLHGGDYLMVLPRALAASIAARLARFVLRARVQVEDAGGDFVLLGLAGPQAASALAQAGERAPRQRLETVRLAHASAVALPDDRLLLACEAPQAQALWLRLSALAPPAAPAVWELLGVRAGIAGVGEETQELFLPQMLGLERIGGVSFDKGCYPGQEIVARTRYLGDLKRRLYRGSSGVPAHPGDAVYVEDPAVGVVGTVANAAPSPEGGSELLLVLQRDAAQQPLRLHGPHGPALTLAASAAVGDPPLERAS